MRRRIVEPIRVVVPEAPANVARSVASFFVAVSDGYRVQCLRKAEATPTGAELLEGARLALRA
jgi:hypothetical protein